jgi:hypothetical protein
VCVAGAVENERHFLLECEAYADLRTQHGFDAGDMRETLAGDQRRLAKYLHGSWTQGPRARAVNAWLCADGRDEIGVFAAD